MLMVARILAAMMLLAGCGGSKTTCEELKASPIDEARSCLRASESIGTARLCYDEEALFAKGPSPVCLIDHQGRLYLAAVQSGKWLLADGWAHSGLPDRIEDTLSPEQRERCAAAMGTLHLSSLIWGPRCE